jgi:GTP-binding protein
MIIGCKSIASSSFRELIGSGIQKRRNFSRIVCRALVIRGGGAGEVKAGGSGGSNQWRCAQQSLPLSLSCHGESWSLLLPSIQRRTMSTQPKRRSSVGGGGGSDGAGSNNKLKKKTRRGGRRYLRQHQQPKPKHQHQSTEPIRRPHRSKVAKGPQASKEKVALPTMLAPTGSPFVYVSQPALRRNPPAIVYHDEVDNEDYEEEDLEISSRMEGSLSEHETKDHHGNDDSDDEDESDTDENSLEEADEEDDDDDDDDDDEEEEEVNASALFAEAFAGTIPSTFASSTFHYMSPRDLRLELPQHNVPEVAFLGRSNVGKSSLVNAVMRQQLCMTSKSPGRTQQAYYYGLFSNSSLHANNTKRSSGNNNNNTTTTKLFGKSTKSSCSISPASAIGFVVDLPGYGYAKAPDDVVGDWQSATQDILLNRRDAGVLQRLYLLLDCRREGPQPVDRTVMSWLDHEEIPYTIVLTKADRVAVPLVLKQVNELCVRFASHSSLEGIVFQSPVIHVTSANDGMGIRELMVSIETEFAGIE